MKKILFILITLLSIVSITGCGVKKENTIIENDEEVLTEDTTHNILVTYFSKSGENYGVGSVDVGNTALMASYISDYLECDSFEIVPVKKYSDNYRTATEEAKNEQNENARPEIKNTIDNINDYDIIFIGYPIWWGDLPMIVYTFLESYDFSNKIVIPFNTHEGSGISGTYNTIKNKLPNSKVNTNGLALKGSEARTDSGKEKTINWLKQLGY
jgi:flavodoxin